MVCHRQKYPVNVLPNEVVYDPPSLPNYIPIELKPVTGPPSNQDVASVQTALRTSESFASGAFLRLSSLLQVNRTYQTHLLQRSPVPSIFDPDVHAQLSQHLFDIQLARHVQRSMTKRFQPVIPPPQIETVRHINSDATDTNNEPEVHIPLDLGGTPQEITEHTGTQHTTPERSSGPNETISYQTPNESNELRRSNEIMLEIRDTLKHVRSILVGSQNSLARGFNSSSSHTRNTEGISHDLGIHSLINEYGEVPETYSLPTFKRLRYSYRNLGFSVNDLTEKVLARYLRFYSLGEEMIEEGEELKIKPGMIDDARSLLSGRLFLDRPC